MVVPLRHEATPDVVIVGSGPNGLTAAVLLARAGLAVRVIEASDLPGGGCRSGNVTLPGFVHDLCSAVHPMGVLSPVFRELELEKFGLAWTAAPRSVAHPLPNGEVAVLEKSFAATAQTLGRDGPAWEALMRPFARERFIQTLLQPAWYLGGGAWMARARFGMMGLRSAERLVRARFEDEKARALFAGCAAHSVLAMNQAGTAAFGLVLAATAHLIDWPCALGGSQAITHALVRALESFGGAVQLQTRVASLNDLPKARAVVFDLHPRQVVRICGEALPADYRKKLTAFQPGPGIFKLDWALREPIPWRNLQCRQAMTVHVGGTFDEIARSESEATGGRAPEHPFVIVAQQSVADTTRAPAGRHTGWGYCHVPNSSAEDMTERIETQIERFAPGFRDCILARHRTSPAQLEARNPAMIGGDMAGGRNDLGQFLFRPLPRLNPYATPNPRLFLCSSSTPPGGGVHGMCGYHAARTVLRRVLGKEGSRQAD